MPSGKIFSIGHSVLPIDGFTGLLKDAQINSIVDVRSSPFSRYHPHFNRDNLRSHLARNHISYTFLGSELGGRPADPTLYNGNTADYEMMARTDNFASGIGQVVEASKTQTVALMCTEKNPMDCHRCLLVARQLAAEGLEAVHILSDGRQETQVDIENRLMEGVEADLLETSEETLARAYRKRSMKIAFKRQDAPEAAVSAPRR